MLLRAETAVQPAVPIRHRDAPRGERSFAVPALASFGMAMLLAWAIDRINTDITDIPEAAVLRVVTLAAAAIPVVAVAFLLWNRERPTVETAASALLYGGVVAVLAIDLHWIAGRIRFPADILIWSESEFVNDILKLRLGYPLYTAQANNESFTYTPGAQGVTYLIARLFGGENSIPLYRVVQVGFTLAATGLALASARRLMQLGGVALRARSALLVSSIGLPFLFLVATNPLSNPFTQDLHNDALALLVNVLGFWLLLRYIQGRDLRVLAAMALIPVVGFAVKQSLLLWGPLYLFYLVAFDERRSWRRVLIFSVGSAGAVGVALLVANALWGEPFWYWTFEVLGARGVSLLRAVQHTIDLWFYWVLGGVGGLLLLRGGTTRVLIGPLLVWLALFGAETYTSGTAWMLNHAGPGCLLAGSWFLAGLARLASVTELPRDRLQRWTQALGTTALLLVLLGGLQLVRIPLPAIPPDGERYVSQIEAEFLDQPAGEVLLDVGSWIYARHGVVMKDRATSIGERGFSQTGDFTGVLDRIRRREYRRILVRNYHTGGFWYDDPGWSVPSGIRAELSSNYREVRTIAPVLDPVSRKPLAYTFQTISVLEPRATTDELSFSTSTLGEP